MCRVAYLMNHESIYCNNYDRHGSMFVLIENKIPCKYKQLKVCKAIESEGFYFYSFLGCIFKSIFANSDSFYLITSN